VEQPIAAALEHASVDVCGPDFALRSDAPRERGREIAAAARDIEHALAAPRPRHRDGEGLPVTVQAERHEIVHHVVALGDAIEDVGDVPRLRILGYLAESEIDFFAHFGSRDAPAAASLAR